MKRPYYLLAVIVGAAIALLLSAFVHITEPQLMLVSLQSYATIHKVCAQRW